MTLILNNKASQIQWLTWIALHAHSFWAAGQLDWAQLCLSRLAMLCRCTGQCELALLHTARWLYLSFIPQRTAEL